ncbi:MAG: hypothetical protein JWO69_1831 [Thermoleophilia bacterium]|jgi:hypothetical protein|nr:hypothetical protein [Thermoleophilia bacterium]
MRRFLLATLVSALLVGCFAGVASARLSDDGGGHRVVDPYRLPAALPKADPLQAGSYGYRTSAAIAAGFSNGDASATDGGGASGGASITVTATVLPVVLVVVDDEGGIESIVTNTPERDARSVLYSFRRGTASGRPTQLDATTWAATRTALRDAKAGAGTIWGE